MLPPDHAPVAMFRREPGGCPDRFDFVVQRGHVLLDEHFPDFPVAPGSQLLHFLWRETSGDPARADRSGVDVMDARFQMPVRTGMRFRCSASEIVLAGVRRRRVRVTDDAGRLCVQAILSPPAGSSPGLFPSDKAATLEPQT